VTQVTGRGIATHFPQRPAEVVRRRQRVSIVGAEPLVPALVQVAGQIVRTARLINEMGTVDPDRKTTGLGLSPTSV
jgi:hypothetical protein